MFAIPIRGLEHVCETDVVPKTMTSGLKDLTVLLSAKYVIVWQDWIPNYFLNIRHISLSPLPFRQINISFSLSGNYPKFQSSACSYH